MCELGLCDSRTKAQALILSGIVYVNGNKIDKSGEPVAQDAVIEIKGNTLPFVSRGGLKLQAALERFPVSPKDLICGDIGASTGGFTDCLLQSGAKRVYSVDVGYGQLDINLRQDERVVVLEKLNARFLSNEHIPEPLDMVVMDVSFISIKLILPNIYSILKSGGTLITLVKPQFEAGRKEISKGAGVVRDPDVRQAVLDDILDFLNKTGFIIHGNMESPIHGPAGNIEFLVWAQKP